MSGQYSTLPGMEYTSALAAIRDHLAAGDGEFAPAGAIHLILRAWEQLAAGDAVWDRLGLEILDVQRRLYRGQDVAVDVEPAQDGPQTRAAVCEVLEQLARHHEQAAGSGELASRLSHDAAAQQCRRAAALLA